MVSAVPEEWKRGIIATLPKKGDLSKCDTWQAIALLSVPGQVLTIVLLNLLQRAVDACLREQQVGF